ncbi:transglutaminase domain-containing protein [Hyphomicrobium sp. CS1GBMeth3]|uniref:transglutaminase-like domain-containing protein n=1 Tax=Hyphomicrobium sp. CS1GBMeth3 TaxID=1892845 RepID=UPI001114C743|nr:transglutaminase domain-containing protein [Hyphomicrobium sp. CS1GBMeth3]
MSRRDVLKAGAAISVLAAFPSVPVHAAFAPRPGTWRNFELVTRVTIAEPTGFMQGWIPLPAFSDPIWFKPAGSTWETNAKTAEIVRDPKYDAEMLHVVWAEGENAPVVEIKSTFATQSRAVDLTKPTGPHTLSDAERALYLAATELIPVDGIVKETSDRLTAGAKSDLDKAQLIYGWIVEATYRDPATRGCGLGDVASMLESGNLGGKCADLNALFVGLARAAGLPARDIYGLRVAPSEFGYRSLGTKNEVVTKAQHCRAEVFLADFGWVPADPADVRKVILEEPPGNLPLTDDKVVQARSALFGSWEGNWLAYNTAHDIALPGSQAPKLGFLMYPQAEVRGMLLDCLDADTFTYAITARELAI